MRRVSISKVSIKIWMGLVILSLFVLILMVITISNTASRVSVIPQLFSPDVMKFNHFVETTNMQVPVKERKLIDEMLIRFYIENRNNYIPNLYELNYRYGKNGPIARMSSSSIFNQFQKQVGNFAENLQDGSSVNTKTIDITRVSRQDNTFTVDFDIYHFDGVKAVFGGSRRVVAQFRYAPAYRRFSTDFVNPYGFVVTSYTETPLKKR